MAHVGLRVQPHLPPAQSKSHVEMSTTASRSVYGRTSHTDTLVSEKGILAIVCMRRTVEAYANCPVIGDTEPKRPDLVRSTKR